AQKALIGQLKQYNALGASRIDSVITTLKALKLKKSRLLLISDAVATAGETSAAQLAAQLKTIAWLERVDILIPSYHNDKKVARSLAKSGKSPGIVAPLTLSNADIIRKLTSTVYADVPIKMSGSTWFWPEKVEALQTNEPLIVFGELSSDQSSTINISVGDKKLSLTSKSANPILLKREWVRARLDKLLDMEDNAQNKDMKSAFHNEIINLSVKERVMSPYTSLLVLETEADYRRYKIDRRGLADILTIGVDGITVIKRAGVEIPIPVVVPIPVPVEPAMPSTSAPMRRAPPSANGRSRDSAEFSAAPPEVVYDVTASMTEADEEVSRVRAVEERHAAPVQYAPAASITVISSAPPAEEPEMQEAPAASRALRRAPPAEEPVRARVVQEKPKKISPWTGKYAEFRALLDKGDAGDFVQKWHQEDLSNVMALIALGEWYEKTDNTTQAARAYGSLIDYFPARADIRRWAAERL
ncbi:hypothetical protein QUF54_08830, partial [Candidatus Marithioploca araucensis]|nr:hypothetical protein [Candidatus Marithioploca araucensis]